MPTFKAWWEDRSLRERRMLIAMFALIGVCLFWYGIILPLENAQGSAAERYNNAAERHASIVAKVEAIKATGGGDSQPGGMAAELPLLVSQSASEAGFTLDRNDAQGPDAVAIAIGSARPTAFFSWIGRLEARGVVVETMTASPSGAGAISVTATLRRRGA